MINTETNILKLVSNYSDAFYVGDKDIYYMLEPYQKNIDLALDTVENTLLEAEATAAQILEEQRIRDEERRRLAEAAETKENPKRFFWQ